MLVSIDDTTGVNFEVPRKETVSFLKPALVCLDYGQTDESGHVPIDMS